MTCDDLPNENRAFLEPLAMNVWQTRREGALIGCLYTLCVIGMIYVAFFRVRANVYRFSALL